MRYVMMFPILLLAGVLTAVVWVVNKVPERWY
jgi:hypothetical protein